MKTFKTLAAAAALATAIGLSAPAYAGGTYKFTVTCSDGVGVAEWRTGDIDPGHEYLRVATGTNNPGCSVSDYSPAFDSWAPVTIYEGIEAIPQGIPFIGEILGNIFDF